MAILTIILAAVLGALSAYFFNYLHWRMVDRRSAITSLGKLLNETIKELEQKAIVYWLADNKITEETKKALEIEIKSYCILNRGLITDFISRVATKAPASSIHTLNRFRDDIFDIATGGSFESKNKTREPRTAAKISKLCVKARAETLKIIH